MLLRISIAGAILSTILSAANAQPNKECGTPAPPIKPVLAAEKLQRAEQLRLLYSAPYPLKVFVRVFANDDGSNLAAAEADILRQFGNMAAFFSTHDICFILAGYEVTWNTDLNNMDKDEANDRSQIEALAVGSCMNIFVHATLVDDDGSLNGTAYDIPSHFLSIVSSAVSSTDNISTMAHEMGHCLGLLHTFEDAYGEEAVARSGSCKDCEDEGDLLCDTQADLELDFNMINTSCNYTGSATDECSVTYLMDETNIMTYGRRSCRDHFTSGQGIRALIHVLNDHESRIAENSLTIGNGSLSFGLISYAARNSISFSATSFTVSSAGRANFSSHSIIFSPGIEFKPSTGYVVARAGTYCQ